MQPSMQGAAGTAVANVHIVLATSSREGGCVAVMATAVIAATTSRRLEKRAGR